MSHTEMAYKVIERAQMGKIWNANFCTYKKIQERNITKLLTGCLLKRLYNAADSAS
jgi:hypothetical protein